jgi:hypothetical protein
VVDFGSQASLEYQSAAVLKALWFGEEEACHSMGILVPSELPMVQADAVDILIMVAPWISRAFPLLGRVMEEGLKK